MDIKKCKPYLETNIDDNRIYIVQVNGFRWSETKNKIIEYFDNVNILNGEKGIHFIIDKKINKCNKMFIQLASENDYKAILNYNQRFIDREKIEGMFKSISNLFQFLIFFFLVSFLLVIKVQKIEKFHDMISKPNYLTDQNVIRMTNLPNNTSKRMIKQFFSR